MNSYQAALFTTTPTGPELVTGPSEQRLDRCPVADVGTDADGLAAGLPYERDGLGGHRLVAVVDDDLVALGGEREADRPTDAVRGAGDEDGARGRWLGHGQPSFGLRVSSRVGTPVVIVSIWSAVRPRSASSGTTRRRMWRVAPAAVHPQVGLERGVERQRDAVPEAVLHEPRHRVRGLPVVGREAARRQDDVVAAQVVAEDAAALGDGAVVVDVGERRVQVADDDARQVGAGVGEDVDDLRGRPSPTGRGGRRSTCRSRPPPGRRRRGRAPRGR